MDEKKQRKKEKVCPLNPELKCEDCKFYQPYLGGGGKRICILLRMVSE